MRASKHKDDMDKVGDVLLTLQGEKSGNAEIDHSELADRTVFALRGFWGFQFRWATWAYGKELNARLRRMSAYGKDEILANMRLNHFMTDPTNLGAAAVELGIFDDICIYF